MSFRPDQDGPSGKGERNMKITGYRCYYIKLPARRVHNWASKMNTPIGSHLLQRLETDEGLSG